MPHPRLVLCGGADIRGPELRPADRSRLGHGRARALCAAPLSRKPVLYRRGPRAGRLRAALVARAGAPMTLPRQLAFALPHAESFAREDFLSGASNAAALQLIEQWPDW